MGKGNEKGKGNEGCSRQLGMTKGAAMQISGKNHSKCSSLKPVHKFPRNMVCSIEDSGLS